MGSENRFYNKKKETVCILNVTLFLGLSLAMSLFQTGLALFHGPVQHRTHLDLVDHTSKPLPWLISLPAFPYLGAGSSVSLTNSLSLCSSLQGITD